MRVTVLAACLLALAAPIATAAPSASGSRYPGGGKRLFMACAGAARPRSC